MIIFKRKYLYGWWWQTRTCIACGQRQKKSADVPGDDAHVMVWVIDGDVIKPDCACHRDAFLN